MVTVNWVQRPVAALRLSHTQCMCARTPVVPLGAPRCLDSRFACIMTASQQGCSRSLSLHTPCRTAYFGAVPELSPEAHCTSTKPAECVTKGTSQAFTMMHRRRVEAHSRAQLVAQSLPAPAASTTGICSMLWTLQPSGMCMLASWDATRS